MTLDASNTILPALEANFGFLKHTIAQGNIVDIYKACVKDPGIIFEYYKSTDAFIIALEAMTVFMIVHLVVGEITRNYSQVDKAWSILPGVYAWHYTIHDYLNRSEFHPRLLLGAILISIWGVRLTYNFARKGGYEWNGRDYRFVYIGGKIGELGMTLLNFIFIGPQQDLILLFMTSPLYLSTYLKDTSLNRYDAIASALFLVFLSIETIADDQQFMFQTKKHALLQFVKHDQKKLSGDYRKGFLSSSGLWQYSRHPNFFSEICMWWCIYLFSIAAANTEQIEIHRAYLNWTIIGTASLTLLFQGSTELTEYISAEKYPEYKEYQRSVSRILPWFPKNRQLHLSKKDM
ncbi:hypothetical protein BX666DRAFT_1875333 [Dichotomocladium elegans]|nr:hypothetical protein BX666DRAFT_1875333 [Dichotomocladium elegans]